MQEQPEETTNQVPHERASKRSNDSTAERNADIIAADELHRELAHIGPKSVKVCYLLCLFFGVLGLHKIYLGQTGKAGLYIVFLLLGCAGYLTWIVLGIFLLQDLMSIPLQVRVYNEELPEKLGRQHRP